MAIHRDSPGNEPETSEFGPAEPHRRFARLVESSGSRRLSFPRLALAVAVIGSVLILVGYVGSWTIAWVTSYVASLDDQQIPFSAIELVPEPDPWVHEGKTLILEQVRLASKREPMIRRLDLDLNRLADDFKALSPWVKRVNRIERPPGRLRIHLEYRQPVAAVVVDRGKQFVESDDRKRLFIEAVDDEGVPLPRNQINWTSREVPYLVKGMSNPLIPIVGADPQSEPRYCEPWQRFDRDGKPIGPDVMLVKAAKIAAFLRKQPTTTPGGKPAPRIDRIFIPGDPSNSFLLNDSEQNVILWGKPPGDEELGDLSAEARWKLLLEWVDRHGPLNVKSPDFLYFDRDSVKFRGPGTAIKGKSAGS